MRKQLYLAIIDRLKQLTDDLGHRLVKHFDLWNLNVEFIELERAFEMPAVFIEFCNIEWKTLSGGVQQADVDVRLHVVTRYRGEAADGSPFQADALEHFDLLEKINKALFGLEGNGFKAFKRIGSATNHNHEEIIENVETYRAMVIDKLL